MSQQINLFNPALIPPDELFSARHVATGSGLLLALLAAAALAGHWFLGRQQIRHEASQQELKTLQERATALAQQASGQRPGAAIQAELDRMQLLSATRRNALSLLGNLTGKNTGGAGASRFSDYLRGLARQSVNGLWLNRVVIGSQSGDLQIQGRTTDRTLVAEYVERLNAEKVFAGHGFTGLSMSQGKEAAAAAGGSVPAPEARPAPYLDFQLTSTPADDPGTGNPDKMPEHRS